MASSAAASEQYSENITTRYTKDGRKISYRLRVVQQPQRARACGQGAKSSSDRRPVDPPPIVQLCILEGDQDTDITFPYNASFFVYATLEPARPIAQARGSHTQPNNDVLAGAPAVGISYLERPNPAGYFIFPDLSVRHEGQYKLRFALFEAMKEPQDTDASAPTGEHVDAYFHNRCEVKSAPFHVYSAKKFPGLTESTLLSRVVADQGCRVRIRRDVRMRRRDSKVEKDWEEAEEAPTAAGAQDDMTSATYESKPIPSPQQQEQNQPTQKFDSAPSSTSTQTIQAPPQPQPSEAVQQPVQAGYSNPQWYQYPPTTQQYQQQMYAPHTPAEPAYVQQQQYQTQYSPAHPPPISQVVQYPSVYGYPPNTPNSIVSNGAMSYPAQSQQQMPSMFGQQQQDFSQQTQMRPQTAMYSPTYNAESQQQFAYQQQSIAYQQQQQAQSSHQQMSQQQQLDPNGTASANNVPLAIGKPLPPLEVPRVSHTSAPEAIVSPSNATSAGRQLGGSSNMGSSPNTQAHYANSLYAGTMNTMSRPPPPQFLSSAGAGLGQKRSYGASFNNLHTQGSMHNGARPNTELAPEWSDGTSEEDLQDLESIKMEYRRADGSYTVVQPRQFRMT